MDGIVDATMGFRIMRNNQLLEDLHFIAELFGVEIANGTKLNPCRTKMVGRYCGMAKAYSLVPMSCSVGYFA